MNKHLLVAYSWSINNIGDIGITPGLLNLLAKNKPEIPVKVIASQSEDKPAYQQVKNYLPAYKNNCEVFPMPFRRGLGPENRTMSEFFSRWVESKLESFQKGCLSSFEATDIVNDILDQLPMEVFQYVRHNIPEIGAAVENAGFVLYNSGTTLNFGRLGIRNLWGYTLPFAMPLLIARKLGIPYGINSQSFDAVEWPVDMIYKKLFSEAKFVYCRDSDSLNYLEQKRLLNKNSGFRPDSTFFFKGFDDNWAGQFMRTNRLEKEKFMCLILRISNTEAIFDDPTGGAVSEERKQGHIRKIITMMREWIHQTGLKILIAHETRDTLSTIPEYLLNVLPEDIMKKCVYLDEFWTSEQAFSVFREARLLVTMEAHSMIMSINVGTPVVHCPFDECGRKKFMLHDLGLADWLVDIDSDDDRVMSETVLKIHHNYKKAKHTLEKLAPVLETKAKATLDEIWRYW